MNDIKNNNPDNPDIKDLQGLQDLNDNQISDSLENQRYFIAIYFPAFTWLVGLLMLILINYFPPQNVTGNNSLQDIAYGLLIGGGIGTGLANKGEKS